MLQLYYESGSTATTSTAIWTDKRISSTVPGVTVDLTSSFSGHTSSYNADISSNTTYPSGGWIIFQTPKNAVPTSSGQYLTNIFLFIEDGNSQIWNTANVKWIEANFTWNGIEEYGTNISSNERAFVSGSDYENINKYEFEENAIFNVYDN